MQHYLSVFRRILHAQMLARADQITVPAVERPIGTPQHESPVFLCLALARVRCTEPWRKA